jgi:hypothetical protein
VRRLGILWVVAGLAASAAAAEWEPLSGVDRLVSWFTSLNARFDQVVITEKKGQLERAIDRLRKDLYALEADTRTLRDGVPDGVPDEAQRARMEQATAALGRTLAALVKTSREVGADLRLNEADQVESEVTHGLRTRGITLSYMQAALEGARGGRWDADAVRAHLDTGIAAVGAAQKAVTQFQLKLTAKT